MKYRYLIKVTYLDGPHAGKMYLLRKGDYVTNIEDAQGYDDTYSSLGFAERACYLKQKENDSNYNCERIWERYRVEHMRKEPRPHDSFIYWKESYTPVRVDPNLCKVDENFLTHEDLVALKSRN